MFNILNIKGLSVFDKVTNLALYALVLLTPLLFLPTTFEFREFNKQSLLLILVAIMLGAWVVRVLTSRRMSWVKTSVDYALLALLVVYLAASVLSVDKISSFLGYYGRFTGSFISVVCFVLLFYLIVNNIRSKESIRGFVNYVSLGMGLTLIYGLLQVLGLYIFPATFTHVKNFNSVGSLTALSIFAASSLVFFQAMGLATKSKRKNWILIFFSLIALAVLFLITPFIIYPVFVWLTVVVGMLVVLALYISDLSPQTAMAQFWQPMTVLVISVLFLAFQFLPAVNPQKLVNLTLPPEVQLSSSATWQMVLNSVKSGTKQAVLGSGPGTVGIVYGGIKPDTLNQTIAWSVNFDHASSEIANIAIETGLLGLLVFELVSLLFLVRSVLFLIKQSSHSSWNYALGFFVLWLVLYLSHFFYFFNSTTYLLFFVSIAGFFAVKHSDREDSHDDTAIMTSSKRNLSWMLVSLLALAVLLVGVFFQAVVYGGEVAYARGIRANQAKDYAKASDNFARAISLNPYRDIYYLVYSQNLVVRASQESAKKNSDQQQIKNLLSSLINAGQKAVQISPEKSSNWRTLASLYAMIRTAVAGADKPMIDSLLKAIEKDPGSPALHYQLSQAYQISAQTIDPTTKTTKYDSGKLKQAEEELNNAIVLKSNLPTFYIQLARLYEIENRLDDAKKKLDDTVRMFPNNPDVWFEDGRITFNQKNLDDAEKIFRQVLRLVPNYANAHYSLGLLYQQKGDKDRALAEFEETSKIVGSNPDLEKLIDNLKAAPSPTK